MKKDVNFKREWVKYSSKSDYFGWGILAKSVGGGILTNYHIKKYHDSIGVLMKNLQKAHFFLQSQSIMMGIFFKKQQKILRILNKETIKRKVLCCSFNTEFRKISKILFLLLSKSACCDGHFCEKITRNKGVFWIQKAQKRRIL